VTAALRSAIVRSRNDPGVPVTRLPSKVVVALIERRPGQVEDLLDVLDLWLDWEVLDCLLAWLSFVEAPGHRDYGIVRDLSQTEAWFCPERALVHYGPYGIGVKLWPDPFVIREALEWWLSTEARMSPSMVDVVERMVARLDSRY